MDCCTPLPREGKARSTCPGCGGRGTRVGEVTLKALLRGPALERRAETEHRFCPTAGCPVVYFGARETFPREDLAVPVFQKEPAGRRTVCYCLGITEPEILRDRNRGGDSPFRQRIMELVKNELCACELRNPQGSCCLGNVASLLRSPGPSP